MQYKQKNELPFLEDYFGKLLKKYDETTKTHDENIDQKITSFFITFLLTLVIMIIVCSILIAWKHILLYADQKIQNFLFSTSASPSDNPAHHDFGMLFDNIIDAGFAIMSFLLILICFFIAGSWAFRAFIWGFLSLKRILFRKFLYLKGELSDYHDRIQKQNTKNATITELTELSQIIQTHYDNIIFSADKISILKKQFSKNTKKISKQTTNPDIKMIETCESIIKNEKQFLIQQLQLLKKNLISWLQTQKNTLSESVKNLKTVNASQNIEAINEQQTRINRQIEQFNAMIISLEQNNKHPISIQ